MFFNTITVRCLFLTLLSGPVSAGFVSPGGPEFNAYVFNDFTLNSGSVQGGIAAGNNVALKNYSLGHALSDADFAIVGGRNVSLVGGSLNGKVSASGDLHVQNMAPVTEGTSNQAFYSQEHFIGLSNSLLSSVNGTTNMQWGRLLLNGQSGGGVSTLVVDVNTVDWGQFWGLATRQTEWDKVIINVPGVNVTVGYIDWLMKSEDYTKTFNSSQVLYNFYEAETLNISGALFGSVLAPKADVTGNYGVIDGQLVANSFYGNIELRNSLFKLELSNDVPVPPYFSVVITVLFLGVLSIRNRRSVSPVNVRVPCLLR